MEQVEILGTIFAREKLLQVMPDLSILDSEPPSLACNTKLTTDGIVNFLILYPVLYKLRLQVLRKHRFRPNMLYNGKGFRADLLNDSGESALHEIAHYLCSPLSRRFVPNFGLGIGSGMGSKHCPLLVSAEEADKEEYATVLLTNKIAKALLPYTIRQKPGRPDRHAKR